jgi:hypothetical protein
MKLLFREEDKRELSTVLRNMSPTVAESGGTGGLMTKKKNMKGTPGPKGERLVIAGNWRDAIKKSFKKVQPLTGWPKPTPKKKSKN